KPLWLSEPGKLWSPWRLDSELLDEGKNDALALSIFDQINAGIDIVSDGEQSRQHFVTTFLESIEGIDHNQKKTITIRNRYEASVPSVVGTISRGKPVFVDDAKLVRSITKQPVKWALPGPLTMPDTAFYGHYIARQKQDLEFV